MLQCGDTFLIEDEDGPECHLWIVITPPNEGEVVIVSITTKRQKPETLVVLKKGDHPFIEHDSVIAYHHSKVVTVESIENAIRRGTAKKHDPASSKLLQRAKSGLLESDFTPNGVRSLYKTFTGERLSKGTILARKARVTSGLPCDRIARPALLGLFEEA